MPFDVAFGADKQVRTRVGEATSPAVQLDERLASSSVNPEGFQRQLRIRRETPSEPRNVLWVCDD